MDGEPREPLNIDDRSGGEKMLDAGRIGMHRISELAEEQRLDVVALIWTASITALTCVQVYSVVHLFGSHVDGFGAWNKIAALGQTGGPTLALGCLAGIALAVMSDSAVARFAILLAGIVGAWVFVAGVFDLLAAVHQGTVASFQANLGSGNRGVGVIGGLSLAGLGLVVLMFAWRAGGPPRSEPAPEVS